MRFNTDQQIAATNEKNFSTYDNPAFGLTIQYP